MEKETKINKKFIIIVIILIFIFAIILTIKGPMAKNNENKNQSVNTEIIGSKEDLISFSILPGSKVSGAVSYQGKIKGGYFFEGNIIVNILNDKFEIIRQGNTMAKTDWMTDEPVDFDGMIDFTGFPKGPAYIEIRQDDPSDGENLKPRKFIHIPIIIE